MKPSLSSILVASVITVALVAICVFALGAHTTPTPAGPTMKQARALLLAVPTPTPVEILWVDTAGNLGLRGVEAVIPNGEIGKDQKVSDACRASATHNGQGTVTICVVPEVGKILAANLGGFLP